MNITDIDTAVEILVEAVKTDYRDNTVRNSNRCDATKVNDDFTKVNLKMISEFEDGVSVTEGSKYIKIQTGHSVWGFIVKGDNDKKFRKGDILKAASWATPARNHARGNVFEGYNVYWTGPHYM